MPRIPLSQSFPHFWPEVHARLNNHDVALDAIDGGSAAYVNSVEASAASGTGALSLTAEISIVTVDGTDARTLAAPTFAGQVKTIAVALDSANTPILNVTVTGMREATQNVWTLTGFVAASAPRSVTFKSYDGVVWDCVAIVSPGSATGVVVA